MSMLFRKLAILFLLFSACQTNPVKQANMIRINRIDEPESLDPRSAHTIMSVGMCRMLFEGLMRVSKTNSLEKALAETVTLDDTLRHYTFTIKPNTYWSNGKEVTSYDFAYAWKTALAPDFVCPLAQSLFCIKGGKKAKQGKIPLSSIAIQTPDRYTLKVELEKPTPYFLELLCLPVYSPICKKYAKKHPNWAKNANSFVCNGPFCINKWKHGESVLFGKNRKYREKELVLIQKISFCMITPEKEWELFHKGELDWAGSPFSRVPSSVLQTLPSNNEVRKSPYLGLYFLKMNLARLEKKFASQEKARSFRHYLFQSWVSQEDNLDKVGHKTALTIVPKELGLLTENYGKQSFPLKETFSSQEKLPTLTIHYVETARCGDLAREVKRKWENSGVKVDLKTITREERRAFLESGDWDIFLTNWFADYFDPATFLEVFKEKKNASFSLYPFFNKKYRSALEAADYSATAKVRKTHLKEAETILLNELPIIPLCHLDMCYKKNEKLKGELLLPMGFLDFRYAYFEE